MINENDIAALGAFQCGTVDTDKIVFSEEVRKLCEANSCGRYGTNWACPPAVGPVEECRKRALEYEKGIVFSGKYELEDSFDWEGMMEGHSSFKKLCALVRAKAKECGEDFLLLSNEGCGKCEDCTYPDAPCRFPEERSAPVEAYGIFVNKLAASAGINYINGKNTVTYIGMLLYGRKDAV